MNEIRFSSPVQNPPPPEKAPSQKSAGQNKGGSLKKFFKFIILIVVLAVAGFGLFLVKDRVLSQSQAVEEGASEYSAVFLSNGQVYFGKMVRKDSLEMVLSDVFYLQISKNGEEAQAQINEPQFSLVKLGNEVHGPTDMLYINMMQVLFYESLREDSQVVESIHSLNPES